MIKFENIFVHLVNAYYCQSHTIQVDEVRVCNLLPVSGFTLLRHIDSTATIASIGGAKTLMLLELAASQLKPRKYLNHIDVICLANTWFGNLRQQKSWFCYPSSIDLLRNLETILTFLYDSIPSQKIWVFSTQENDLKITDISCVEVICVFCK